MPDRKSAIADEEGFSTVSPIEGWSVFSLVVAVTAAVGYVGVRAEAVNWRALAALAHAQDVLRQEKLVNLALIGFVEPPLPALLHIPIAWIAPSAVTTGHAVWIVGALIAGLSLRMLNGICANLGLGRIGRWIICVLGLGNPVYLGLVATGSPDALYVLLLLGATWSLFRWERQGALRDLISCSLFLSLAFLARYDAVVPILAATSVVTFETLRSGGRWPKLEGTLITFLLPIAYLPGLWVLANWLIIGDPWHFWRSFWHQDISARQAPGLWWQSMLGAVVVFVPLAAAVWWAVWGGAAGRARAAWGAALVLVSPALAVLVWPRAFGLWIAHAHAANLPLIPIPELFAPMLAAGWFLTACAASDLLKLFERKTFTKEVCLAGSGALLGFSLLLVSGADERVYLDPRPALRGELLGTDSSRSTRAVAEKLRTRERNETEGALVVAGWPGYAVTLYAGRTSNKVLLVSTDPPDEPLTDTPASALLIRDGESLEKDAALRRRWEQVLDARLDRKALWIVEGWAYYRMSALRGPREAAPRR